MHTDDLVRRGFVWHRRLGIFWTFCPVCRVYRYHEWWAAPRVSDGKWRKTETTACSECRTVDHRDVEWIERDYPERNEVAA